MGEERDEEGKKDEGGFGMKSGIMRLETMRGGEGRPGLYSRRETAQETRNHALKALPGTSTCFTRSHESHCPFEAQRRGRKSGS